VEFRVCPRGPWSRVSSPSYAPWRSLPPWRRSGALLRGYKPRQERCPLPRSERRLWGRMRDGGAVVFLSELPPELIQATFPQRKTWPRPSAARAVDRLTRVDRGTANGWPPVWQPRSPANALRRVRLALPGRLAINCATPASRRHDHPTCR